MIPLLIAGIVSAAGSIGSSIWGSISGNKKRRKAENKMRDKKSRLDNWRRDQLNQSFLDRSDSQAALRQVKEYNKEAIDNLNSNAIKRGVSDQAKVSMAGKLNKNYSNVVSQLAGLSSQHKDRVNSQWLSSTANLDNLEIQNLMDNSGTQNMINGISNAGMQLAQLYAMGGSGGNKN